MSFGLLQGMGFDTWNMRRQPAFQVINATLHTTQQHMHLYQAESSAALQAAHENAERLQVFSGFAIFIPIVSGASPGRALRVRRSIVVLGSSKYHGPVGARSVRRTLGRRTRAVTFGPLHT